MLVLRLLWFDEPRKLSFLWAIIYTASSDA
jgi:hypothetical protein